MFKRNWYDSIVLFMYFIDTLIIFCPDVKGYVIYPSDYLQYIRSQRSDFPSEDMT